MDPFGLGLCRVALHALKLHIAGCMNSLSTCYLDPASLVVHESIVDHHYDLRRSLHKADVFLMYKSLRQCFDYGVWGNDGHAMYLAC